MCKDRPARPPRHSPAHSRNSPRPAPRCRRRRWTPPGSSSWSLPCRGQDGAVVDRQQRRRGRAGDAAHSIRLNTSEGEQNVVQTATVPARSHHHRCCAGSRRLPRTPPCTGKTRSYRRTTCHPELPSSPPTATHVVTLKQLTVCSGGFVPDFRVVQLAPPFGVWSGRLRPRRALQSRDGWHRSSCLARSSTLSSSCVVLRPAPTQPPLAWCRIVPPPIPTATQSLSLGQLTPE